MRILLNLFVLTCITLSACNRQSDNSTGSAEKSNPDAVKGHQAGNEIWDDLPTDTFPMLKQAIKQLESGDTVTAIQSFRKSGMPIGRLNQKLINEGYSAYQNGDYGQLEGVSKILVDLNPNNELYPQSLLELYYRKNRDNDALSLATDFLERNPKAFGVRAQRAQIYARLGMMDKAISDAEALIRQEPDSARSYNMKAFILAEYGRPEEAIKAATAGLRINPSYPFLLNNLGYAYFQLGDQQAAHALYLKSLELESNNAYLYRNLALLAIQTNSKAEICRALQEARNKRFVEHISNQLDSLETTYCK